MEKVGLNITPKEFKQLSKWSENIYNTAVVIDYFVSTYAKNMNSDGRIRISMFVHTRQIV